MYNNDFIILVDENGQPVFYKTPRSWEEATNDGERLRWLLGEIAKNGRPDDAAIWYADFLCSQFDVSNLFGLNRDRDMAKWLAELDDLHEVTPPHTAIKPTTNTSETRAFAHFFIVLSI